VLERFDDSLALGRDLNGFRFSSSNFRNWHERSAPSSELLLRPAYERTQRRPPGNGAHDPFLQIWAACDYRVAQSCSALLAT
jgi:hypothetical protein